MSEARQFLIDDISAMLNPDKSHEWLEMVNEAALYDLWQDLIILTSIDDSEGFIPNDT
jgi:hypothetical protein